MRRRSGGGLARAGIRKRFVGIGGPFKRGGDMGGMGAGPKRRRAPRPQRQRTRRRRFFAGRRRDRGN